MLKLPDENDALSCIDKMDVSKAERERILAEYYRLYDAKKAAGIYNVVRQTASNAGSEEKKYLFLPEEKTAFFNEAKPPSKPNPSARPSAPQNKYVSRLIGLCVLFVVCFAGLGIYSLVSPIAKQSAPSAVHRTSPASLPSRQRIPENGTTYSYEGLATLEKTAAFIITTPKEPRGEYYYILLRDPAADKNVMGLFIHAGSTYEFMVPEGTFDIYVASGRNWQGKNELFGRDGSYSKAETAQTYAEKPTGASAEITLNAPEESPGSAEPFDSFPENPEYEIMTGQSYRQFNFPSYE